MVVKSGSDLDQALQERFLRLGFDEPYLFPEFMGLEESLLVEMRKPLFELFLSLCGFHREIIRIPIESSLHISR